MARTKGNFAVTAAKPLWRAPAGLIALSLVPVAAGAVRVAQLTGGADITPQNGRFFAAPVPVLVHIVSASVYCLLGALQFAPGFRRRRPGWHRVAGRLLVPCGLAAAFSGLWMTLFYPHPDSGGDLLTGFRLVFGSAMVGSIVLGFAAIRGRNIARHRAWMIRGYAIGQGAGTQFLIILPWVLILGQPGELGDGLLHGAGWLINLAVAEWIVRRRPNKPIRASAGPTGAVVGGLAGPPKATRRVLSGAGPSGQPTYSATTSPVTEIR
jgi:uncharacterized membrane protein